ncbi:ATP-binding protein [Desulfovibrio inopinatus]|uniref:ATP-binding protein n=1 Tax=Desulfovibrio inopinatus TaxID=102109 RepID=UPI000409BEF5|nr:ATP-binding protein [Desulfovibrio inopinatus]
MDNKIFDPPKPEACVSKIFEASGAKFDTDVATNLWKKIMRHKWILSERLNRDVGFRIACNDFLENIGTDEEVTTHNQEKLLVQMGARTISRDIWDTISDTQPPKQLIQKKIILPLIEGDLSQKHGVIPPKNIIFFGPPGTGKTHFVKAMAGRLAWWYVEIVPSILMIDGVDKIGMHLRELMEKARNLDEVVLFIDEFEELAGSRDTANRVDRSITNEFLKQVPLMKSHTNKVLLVCATNYIRQLDAALLRPGRFDYVIPVGSLDDDGRRTVLSYYLSKMNTEVIDLDLLITLTTKFTPADIEYLFQNVAQQAFEKECESRINFPVTTSIIVDAINLFKPSLTETMDEEFRKDVATYSRI